MQHKQTVEELNTEVEHLTGAIKTELGKPAPDKSAIEKLEEELKAAMDKYILASTALNHL